MASSVPNRTILEPSWAIGPSSPTLTATRLRWHAERRSRSLSRRPANLSGRRAFRPIVDGRVVIGAVHQHTESGRSARILLRSPG
jgi:hypothetical protein